ncbi:MAG TPA: GNAT family N-acetyltransferase, partial [Candidatus Binatus sp.]|nr:GNAT family N-acetyltransferase [Candidatus Binatus sp.]
MDTRMTIDLAAGVGRDPLAGLRLRPYAGQSDLAAIARIENAEAEADSLPERMDEASIRVRFSHPSEHFQPGRDVTVAEVDGQMVAVASREWVDTTDGVREYRMGGAVDPAWRRRGIGTALLAAHVGASRQLAAAQDVARRQVL